MLTIMVIVATGCARYGDRGIPAQTKLDQAEDRHAGSALLSAQTFPLDSPTSVVGFGEDSLWVTDLGDYKCDDTPGIEASCASPESVFLKRMDPETRKVTATIPLRGADGVTLAFGAGSVWISLQSYNPSRGGVLRLDPETNEVMDRIPVRDPSGLDFGEGSLWITSFDSGAVSRVDPATKKVVEEIKASGGSTSDVAVGEGSVWVASWSPEGNPNLSEEDYERGTLPEPSEDAKLVRIDPASGEVVAEIPVENRAIEGGASSVAVDETGAVWVTSVNARLLRVDPGTNEVVAELHVGDYSFEVGAGAGSVWTTSEVNVNSANSYTNRLTRVDPASNTISGHLDRDGASGLAFEDGVVWLGSGDIETGKGSLTKITP